MASSLQGSSTLLLPGPDSVAIDRGYIDGGWWPRSLELAVELPPLLEEVLAAGFDITDVLYNVRAWQPAPHQVSVSGHSISLHGDATQDGASIQLLDSTGLKPVVVVVIPPGTDPLVAEHALFLAGRDGDLHRPDQILARAEVQAAAHERVEPGQQPPPADRVSTPDAMKTMGGLDDTTDG